MLKVPRRLFTTQSPAKTADTFIQTHPLTHSLRANRTFIESRPHLHAPGLLRAETLMGGSLAGSEKITVPPYVFRKRGGGKCVIIMHLGSDVCSHPGVVHGGLLATLLDETFAWCCLPRFPKRVGVTANLSVNYRAPAMADSYVVVNAEIVKMEERKAWLEGRVETLEAGGACSTLLADAQALFVEPKKSDVSLSWAMPGTYCRKLGADGLRDWVVFI